MGVWTDLSEGDLYGGEESEEHDDELQDLAGLTAMLAQLRSVDYSYGRRTALDSVTLSIQTGITALLGPNGAGKSTLMKLLATLAVPTRGVVEVLGWETASRSGRNKIRRQLGYLPQHFPLVGNMRVLDAVAYCGWANGLSRSEALSAAASALDSVGLSGYEERRCRALSGGERQRVGIAMAISHRPSVVILDEPTAGLDPEARMVLRGVLKEVADSTSILVSTHLVDDVVQLADQIVVLDKGTLLFTGSVSDLEGEEGEFGSAELGTPMERSYAALLRRNRS